MSGAVVSGNKYFKRPKDENKLWRKLKQGKNLLLKAPRRVGKTSMVKYMADHPEEGFEIIYVYVQQCKNETEFYQKILQKIYDSSYLGKTNKLKVAFSNALSSRNIQLNIGLDAASVSMAKHDHKQKINADNLRDVLKQGFQKNDKKIIIALDEFPDVLDKISRNDERHSAETFLAGIRDLCDDSELNNYVQFIFTGSIGLDTLTEKLGISNLINSIVPVSINPLSDKDALAFISFYMNNNAEDIVLDDATKHNIIERIGWNMPYYISLVCDELIDIYEDKERPIIESDVNDALITLLSQANTTQFSHWQERLNRLENIEKNFAKDFLKLLAQQTASLSKAAAFNLSQHEKYRETVRYRYLINCLKNDGYIFETEAGSFEFSSPLLKKWWIQHGY